MSVRGAQALLIAVIATRATALLFSKLLLASIGPFTLLGVRFLLAFALLVVVFHKQLARMNKRLFVYGLALGSAFFVVMALEMFALRITLSSHVAFLENAAIVLVPVCEAVLLHRAPSFRMALGAAAALFGVGLICLGGSGGALTAGDAIVLAAAGFYTAVIMMCARMSRNEDAIALGVLQVGWIGVLGALCSFAFETPVLPQTVQQWGSLAVLVVACTGFGFTLQPMAQKHLSSERASLTLAVDPLVATVLGIVVLGEQVGIAGYAGMALVLASIVASCLPEGRPNDESEGADVRLHVRFVRPRRARGRAMRAVTSRILRRAWCGYCRRRSPTSNRRNARVP